MAYTLVLNSANVSSSTNTQFKYAFLGGNFIAKDMEMCISQVAIPYAFYNVSAFYNNQTFSIIFPVGASTYTLPITLAAGFYQVSDINSYIQNQCIANGLYLINSTGQYVYFFTIATNVTYYTTQTLYFPVPTFATYAALGYTLPSTGQWSGTGLPTTANQVPQLVLPATGGINTIIGYVAGTFPTSSTSATNVSVLGTVTPVGSTVNSIVARVSFLRNTVSVPSDILDAWNINTIFGSNITYAPSFEKWITITDGTYSNFIFQLVDQNLNTIYSNDANIGVSLLIRKKI